METNFNKVAREAKRIYKECDVKMKQVASVCTKGCNHCCHQLIRVHIAEEMIVTKYLKENFTKDELQGAKTRLEAWFEYFNNNTPSKSPLESTDIELFAIKLAEDRFPCPFLDDDVCTIYPVRPLVCRTFTVNDTPEACKADPVRVGDMRGYHIQETAFKEIARAADVFYMRLFPYVLTDFFSIKNCTKTIASEAVMTLSRRTAQQGGGTQSAR